MAYFLLHNGQPSARRLLSRVSRLSKYVSANATDASDYVIRWGLSDESDPSQANILNSRDSILRAASRSQMARFLRRVGVRFALPTSKDSGDTGRFIRHYRIPFFDLQPIACFRADAGVAWINSRIQRVQPSFREIGLQDDKVTTRAIFLASRALHALGLDLGLVSLGMGPKGILHVLDITPTPVLEGRMLELYSTAIERFIEREDRLAHAGIQSVTLGTDVEVMLRNTEGRMVLASKYFSRKGRVGCDDRSVQYDGKRLPLVELRPDPDSSPTGLVNQLRETMLDGIMKINRSQVEWRAGSMPFPPYSTGGHIHFSNIPFSSQLVKALDNYVGLPLMAIEYRPTAQLRRPRYGFLGDVRQKDYGGFEYRTPASFIVNPIITTAAFSLAYLVALYHRELPCFDLYEPSVQLAFYKNNVDALSPILERNMDNIRKLPLYDRYRESIEYLFKMIESGQTWNEDIDIRSAWGLPTHQQKTRRHVRSRRMRASG